MGTLDPAHIDCVSHLHTNNLAATAVQHPPPQGWLCPRPQAGSVLQGLLGRAAAWVGVFFSLWRSQGHYKSGHISVLSFPQHKL